MPAVLSSLKPGLLAAAFAGLIAIGVLTPASAGPVFAQPDAPNLGATRAAEVLPSATSYGQAATSANVGNPVPASGPERRVALVIGNSAYENVTALPNPANDATAIGGFLNSAGFEVIQATDIDHDEMIQVLQDFSTKISERGPNTVAFVYYAGHGVQIAGDNYLLPVDARISSEADVPNAAVRLVDVMATLQAVPSRMRIVVLDACRNNPFSQMKDTGRGLAIVDAPNGSIVGYATAPGAEAFDGEGENSPYTSAFLRLGREPNLSIEQFFKKVRVVVNDVTDGRQTPWESSSLTSDFYFFGDTAVAAARNADPVLSANASANRPMAMAQNMRSRTPREAYNYAIAENSVESYEGFVKVYPYDPFAAHIRRLLAAKLLAIAWHSAVKANSPLAYKAFYSTHSDSPFATMAMKLAVQPKVMPLYQPTKIMVAPQIAPKVKLGNFNGVDIGEGTNAPIGLGGDGSLFNRKLRSTVGLGNPVSGNVGLKSGLPGGRDGEERLPGRKPLAPGVDLAKDVKRLDTKIEGGRFTRLPLTKDAVRRDAPAIDIGNAAGRDVKVLDRNSRIRDHIDNRRRGKQVLNGQIDGQPLVKDRQRITTIQRRRASEKPAVTKFQPPQRLRLKNDGDGNGTQLRGSRAMSFGSGNSGGSSSRFAGGGTGLGRSFR